MVENDQYNLCDKGKNIFQKIMGSPSNEGTVGLEVDKFIFQN